MDLEKLSRDYGDRLTFFGGICNQKVLPFLSPEEIDENVRQVRNTLGAHGRYVISPSNGIGPDVPMENVEAYFQAARKYRRL